MNDSLKAHGKVGPWSDDSVAGQENMNVVPERRIGSILVKSGKLAPETVDRVLTEQRKSGALFGATAVALRVVSSKDVDIALSRQYRYPVAYANDAPIEPSVAAAFGPATPFSEAMRALRSQLLLRWARSGSNLRMLTMVSLDQKDGRSLLAANLAVVFSQMGQKTLLVDADLRRPSLHELFRIRSTHGLSGILSGRAGIEEIVRVPAMLDLSVLPGGPPPPNPLELLTHSSMTRLLGEVSQLYDVVILDSPAARNFADAQIIAAASGAAVVIGRHNVSELKLLRQLTASLADSGVEILGAVSNKPR